MLISNGNSLSPGLSEYVGDGKVVELPRTDDPEFSRAALQADEIGVESAVSGLAVEEVVRVGKHNLGQRAVHSVLDETVIVPRR